jgi:vitamin B12 transporter
MLTVVSATASAQSPDTTTLSAVVVSATKIPSSRSSLTQQVTVLSGGDLRARGITRVSDALRLVPGASLVQNGSTGSVNTLFLRGGESRYTKVLIDGVAVNAPGGFFDFSHLTTDNVERIEIVRGPASVVHGADAVSGIVQIFTRQGRGPLSLSAEGRAGNYGSREATVETNGGGRIMRFALGGGTRRTDGALPFNNNYYNGTLSGSLGITPRKGTDALFSTRYTNAEFHYPTDFTGAPVDSNAYRVQHRLTIGMDAKSKLAENTTARLLLGNNEVSDLTEDIFVPFGIPESPPPKRHSALLSRNKRRSAEAGLTFNLPQSSTLNIGAEYTNESENSTNGEGAVGAPTTPTSKFSAARHNTAFYSELTATSPAGASWTISARRDDNSDYDAFNTYRAGASLPVGASSRLRATISTAFSAPAFNQLRPTLYTTGSPDLKPERARSWEVGMEQTLVYGILKLSANYFHQRFSDLIQYVPGGPPNYLGRFANLTEAISNGYESELTLTPLNEWSGTASYTVAKPHASKVPADFPGDLRAGNALIRRPTRSGTGSIAWSRAGAGSFAVMASYIGERPDLDFNEFPSPTVTLPAYTKVDVAASLQIFRSESKKSSISLTGRVDNALDKKYEDVLHFAAPRRQYLIGARIEGAM